jgi:hypothetical protein
VQGGRDKQAATWRSTRFALGLLACTLALLAPASSASAGTRVVANLNDSGAGSLRAAVAEAAVNETIVLPSGQITLTSGPIAFEKNLTIVGVGPGGSIVSGNEASRVFTITGTPRVSLEGLTVTHGKATTGAGILASGEITLENVAVTANHAGGSGVAGFGGGLDLGPGTYTLSDTVVSENTAGGGTGGAGFGGGIEYSPTAEKQSLTLSLVRSRVTGNRAGVGDAGFGGGLDASSGQDNGAISISLSNSSLAGNVAGGSGPESGFGGGLDLSSGGKNNVLALTIDRSAVTSNTAGGGAAKSSGFGGGITYSSGGEGVTQTLTVTNTTIANNTAGGGGAEANGFGGGLEFGGGTGTLSHLTVAGNSAGGGGGTSFGAGLDLGPLGTGGIDNSIVAANSGGNCAGAVVSRGHNLDDGTSCGFSGTGDKSGADAKLGPLGEHGGPTPTRMPLAGSPAIDAGDAATCPSSDQRGVARPQGGGCDIGAVEVQRPGVTTSSVTSQTSDAASVGGTVNPNFSATTYHVDFGTTTAYGSATAETSVGEGSAAQSVTAALSKLQAQKLYHFRVVASNAAGTSVGGDQTFTTAKAPVAVTIKKTAPVVRLALRSVTVTNKRFRVGTSSTAISARRAPIGTRFRFNLSAPAQVRIAITRLARGLRRGRSCVAPTSRLRRAHAKPCLRRVTVGTLTRSGLRKGVNSIAFSGRIGRRPLAPRAYRAILTATSSGKRSAPSAVEFFVVR